MPGPRFNKQEVEKRRETVSGLYLQGKSYGQIALEVGVSTSQVHLDVKLIRSLWRSNTLRNFDEARNVELARIDQAETEAWKGWARSVGKVQTLREESGGLYGAKTVVTTETQAGDPRFLQTVLECVRERCRILGLNAPVEARITGRLSIDDLRAILDAGEEVIDVEPNAPIPPEQIQ